MSKTRTLVMLAVLLAGWMAFGTLQALAQTTSSGDMQILREKLQADKKLLVSANMELTPAEAKGFWPVYQKYQDELFLLRMRTLKLIDAYATAYDTMNDKTAGKLLQEYMTIESLRMKLRETYLPKFSKVLPTTKVVRYFQIENKINAVLAYELAARIPLMKAAQ